MAEFNFLFLCLVVLSLWVRACLKLHKLTQTDQDKNRTFWGQIGQQLGDYDLYMGILFGRAERYSLYHSELAALITEIRAAFKLAIWAILLFILYLIFNFGL
ncbi:hypothetical protein [Shewanella sp. BJSY2023SW001]|uniref:hypothetical protein n=1 Tax=Shewanella sp. BJSY2023SW001 TaxID=3392039 RepID=UPI0039B488E5